MKVVKRAGMLLPAPFIRAGGEVTAARPPPKEGRYEMNNGQEAGSDARMKSEQVNSVFKQEPPLICHYR